MPFQSERSRLSPTADDAISVTIDATDLTSSSAEPIRDIISRFGRPASARAFADFMQTSLAELAIQLYQMGFTLVHCPTWPNGEGFPKPVVTDILAQDLRDQVEELDGVDVFVLVATSREYIAVANALRRHEKHVVVVADEAKVSRELRLCADEFVGIPASKPDRAATTRVPRGPRPGLSVRLPEPLARLPEPVRVERPAEPPRVERAAEPVQPAEQVRPEPADAVKLPGDADVVAEVRRIVAAEGICTPRRLSRALCPVDRTPTGELRSRIANHIQSLIDAGTLIREKLVVGGTSVETILVGEDRAERPEQAPAEPTEVRAPSRRSSRRRSRGEREQPTSAATGDADEHAATSPPELPEPAVQRAASLPETPRPARDLDALVESVLRSGELPSAAPDLDGPVPETEPRLASEETPAEKPKRPRARRRPAAKKPAPETES